MNVSSILYGVGSNLAKGLLDKGLRYGMSFIKSGKMGIGDNLSKTRTINKMEMALDHVKQAEKIIEEEIQDLMEIEQ